MSISVISAFLDCFNCKKIQFWKKNFFGRKLSSQLETINRNLCRLKSKCLNFEILLLKEVEIIVPFGIFCLGSVAFWSIRISKQFNNVRWFESRWKRELDFQIMQCVKKIYKVLLRPSFNNLGRCLRLRNITLSTLVHAITNHPCIKLKRTNRLAHRHTHMCTNFILYTPF